MYLLPIKAKLSPYFSESKEKLEIPDTHKKSPQLTHVASRAQCQQKENEESN